MARADGSRLDRHAAITAALDAGCSLRDGQDYARHADPRQTRRYDRARGALDRNPYIVAPTSPVPPAPVELLAPNPAAAGSTAAMAQAQRGRKGGSERHARRA